MSGVNGRVPAEGGADAVRAGVTGETVVRGSLENLKLFLGAFVQVMAVATNTRVIAHGDLFAMFWTGGLVSWIWWANVRGARAEGIAPRAAYTLGAACGTVVGGWLGSFLM